MKATGALLLSVALLASAASLCAKTRPPGVAVKLAQSSSDQPGVVSPGTRFLVRLDGAISTKTAKPGTAFKAHTLDPLTTPDGQVLRPGAEIRGHIDKVERAQDVGRARIWLAFDDIATARGWQPLVAVVSDVPGIRSVRAVYEREGEIESTSSKRQEEAQAAAAGALVGAAPGVVARSGKGAAIGAATGALTAFLISSGLGHELTLEKNTKLELVLDHPLYLD